MPDLNVFDYKRTSAFAVLQLCRSSLACLGSYPAVAAFGKLPGADIVVLAPVQFEAAICLRRKVT